MKFFLNWRTTLGGIVGVITALAALYDAYINGTLNNTTLTAAIGGISTALGLVFAKDSNVTGTGANARSGG